MSHRSHPGERGRGRLRECRLMLCLHPVFCSLMIVTGSCPGVRAQPTLLQGRTKFPTDWLRSFGVTVLSVLQSFLLPSLISFTPLLVLNPWVLPSKLLACKSPSQSQFLGDSVCKRCISFLFLFFQTENTT